ncbi:MAG: undecaprenyl diphosphate synthase family protein [Sporolactobacillus sp.]
MVNFAFNYGGRYDLVQATQAIADDVLKSKLSLNEINEKTIENHLLTSGLPNPDIFIRTGGEKRLSNFLLWQLGNTEM